MDFFKRLAQLKRIDLVIMSRVCVCVSDLETTSVIIVASRPLCPDDLCLFGFLDTIETDLKINICLKLKN